MKNMHENKEDAPLLRGIQERMNGYEEQPEDDSWEFISKHITEEKKKRKWMVYSRAAFTAILLSSLFAIIQKDRQHVTEITESSTNTSAFSLELKLPANNQISVLEGANSGVRPVRPKYNLAVSNEEPPVLQPSIQSISNTKETDVVKSVVMGENLTLQKENLSLQLIEKKDTIIDEAEEIKDNKEKKQKRFNLYALLSPSLNYQIVNPLEEDNTYITKLNTPSILSPQRVGVSIEIGTDYRLSNKWEIFGGAFYYFQNKTFSYNYKSNQTFTFSYVKEGDYYLVQEGEDEMKFNYDMRNLGVKAGVMYKVKGEKLMQKIGGGLFYQHGTKNISGAYYQNAKSSYAGIQLFYRFEYVINNQTNFLIQPSFSQSILMNETLSQPMKLKPYQVNLSFGLTRRF